MPSFISNLFHFLRGPWGRTYAVTLVFVALASALFWADFFRAYRSETSFLFIAPAGHSASEIAGSMQAVAESLSFYERLERDFPEAAKRTREGETPEREAKRAYWRGALSTEAPFDTGILTLRIETPHQGETRVLSEAAKKTVFAATSLYYQGENAVEVRVIEGPAFQRGLRSVPLYWLAVLLTALAVTTLFFGLLAWLSASPFAFARRGRKQSSQSERLRTALANRVGESVPWIDPGKFVPVRPASLEMGYGENEEAKAAEIAPRKATPKPQPKAAAPGNLPVMEDIPSFQFGDSESQPPAPLPEAPAAPALSEEQATMEPSVEEYKRRLNELLRGKPLR